MKLPTGSKIQLAMSCLAPFTSGIPWAYDDSSNAAIDFGNACHDVSERYIKAEPVDLVAIGAARNLSASDQKRFERVAVVVVDMIDNLRAAGWELEAEQAIAYHATNGTARVMTRKSHRDYSDRRAGELTATTDIVMRRGPESAIVDIKTGRRIAHDDHKTSWQMMFGGLAVATLHGVDEVTATLAYVDEGGHWFDSASLDCFDLCDIADSIASLWTKLHAGPAAPVPGAHCTSCYCPLLGKCSATRGALAEVVSDSPLLAKLHEPGAAKRALELLPNAQAALDAIKKELEVIAGRDPIDLGGGKFWGKVEQEREYIKMSKSAFEVLVELIGEEKANAAVEVKYDASKASIVRAAGGQKAARNVLEQLRSIGATRTSKYTTFSEFVKGEDAE